MMSISIVTEATPHDYYAKDANYYTREMTSHDRWQGKLSKNLPPLSQESYDAIRNHLIDRGKKRIGADCVMSAPKSVSLALAASEETRNTILQIHYHSVNLALSEIEKNFIFTRLRHGKDDTARELVKTNNMLASCFTHYMSRAEDLDLHTHCVIANATFLNGKEYSIDYGTLMDNEKEIGLAYRRELAKGLQDAGFILEITDPKKGFFELKSFDREVIEEYSTRRAEIMATGATSSRELSNAAKMTRRKKRQLNLDEKMNEIRRDLFENNKIIIERNVTDNGSKMAWQQTKSDGKKVGQESHSEQRANFDGSNRQSISDAFAGGASTDQASSRAANIDAAGEAQGQEPGEFANFSAMQDLPVFNGNAPGDRADNLLYGSTEHFLAVEQSKNQRDVLLQQEAANEKRARRYAIARDAISELAKEKFAFTRKEALFRIQAAGVIEGIDDKDALRLLNSLRLIDVGINRASKKPDETFITTRQNIATEKAILNYASEGKSIFNDALSSDLASSKIDALAIKRKERGEEFTPTDEQRAAILHALSCPDHFLAIQGLAGVGKTYSMDALREIYESIGITVRGMAFSGKAADGLQNDSGISSTTIHSFLNNIEKLGHITDDEPTSSHSIKQEWDFSSVPKASNREVWIVDEAGLINMHLMYQLMNAARARGAQVILSGDYSQLPPIGAGSPYKQMIEHGLSAAYLTDIRRQKNLDLRASVMESVAGDPLKTYRYLESQGNYTEIANTKVRQKAITDVAVKTSLAEYKSQLVLTATNAMRKALNKKIRDEYVKRGELDAGQRFEITVQKNGKEITEHRSFAKGDRIVFTANDKRIGVMNGTLATIIAIDDLGKKFSVLTDAGDKREFYIDSYNKIDYAYCVTSYKAQGMTVQSVIADMPTKGASESRNALYVDISRAKINATIFTDDKKALERQTSKFVDKVTSESFARETLAMKKANVDGKSNYMEQNSTDLDLIAYEIKESQEEAKHNGHDSTNDEAQIGGASRGDIEAKSAALLREDASRRELNEKLGDFKQSEREDKPIGGKNSGTGKPACHEDSNHISR